VTRALFVLGLVASVLGCDLAPTVPGRTDAYPFTTIPRFPGDTARVLRWPVGATIRVFIEGGTGARAMTLLDAFERGAELWNDAALYGEYRLLRTVTRPEADVVLTWSDLPPVVDPSNCRVDIGRAVTTFCLRSDRQGLEVFPLVPPDANRGPGSVKMLVTVLGSESTPAAADRLVTHELGHVLGIAQHSLNPADLMHVTNSVAAPSRADAATAQILYHTPADLTP
jgi:hypothetical protein